MVKWSGTILCLIGIGLTAFNIFPLNVIFSLIGSGLWTLAGYLQKDKPLFIVELVAVIFYITGLFKWLLD